MNTMNSSAMSARNRYEPPADSDTLWHALTDDAGVAVMVLNDEGMVEYANLEANRVVTGDPLTSIAGRAFSELYDRQISQERLDIVMEVLRSGNVTTLDGMLKGRFYRTVFRALNIDADSPKALITMRLGPDQSRRTGIPVPRARYEDRGALASLTSREMDILKLIGVGLSTADIAKRLHRSVKTIEWHRVSLGNKLGVNNRVELARIALGAGLVGLEGDAITPSDGGDED